LKAKSGKKVSLFLYFLFPILFASCYTVEFKPVPDYPVLREVNTDEVVITYSYPGTDMEPLGTLLIRDFSGDLNDPQFLSYIKREARKRGAPGAWIQERRLSKVDSFHADHSGGRQNSIERNESRGGTILKTDLGIVSVLLFTYKKKDTRKGQK
jgi:hypothetical protein